MTTILRYILFFLLTPAFAIVAQVAGAGQDDFRIVDIGFKTESAILDSVDGGIFNYDSSGAQLQRRRSLDGKGDDGDDLSGREALATSGAARPLFSFLSEFVAANRLDNVWSKAATQRGIDIENHLAKTDYADWFNVGKLNRGYFPLVDFQKGNNLVSLKTVDTTGSTWMSRMRNHIDDLGSNGATVNGNPANMILDMRVQPGGSGAAQSLIDFGAENGVQVLIREF